MIEVQEFRAEVRQWLADNLTGEFAALKGLGGPGREHEAFEERLAWNRHLAAAGLTCLGWPEEYGGRGLSVAHRVAFYEEYAIANAPAKVNHLGEELLGPTLIAYGTDEQKQRFLPRIVDVTELWSQGYSEPGAGSDLANVSTTAVLDGDQWVLNGQKVWTSLAHWAQWCFVVARTEKGSKRHAGLSYLLVPLDQPGVEIRPIIQLTGDSEFNEVFFDDARTDASMVVGEPGDGWRVAMGTLTFERGVSTLGQQIEYARELSGVAELAKKTGAADDPLIREQLTRSWVGLRTMRSYALATMDAEESGRAAPGKDNVSKLLWANWHRELGEIAMAVAGRAGLTLDDGEFDEWQRLYLFSRSDTIYGGSNEIQRNIIAERVLGLPREARP
ncbi:acyl-CoA dehydrogenase IpdE1 [Mycolicibacterium sp. F2034L]|uniref:acyl-CoA dehydrogenase IpdE1 n=1 Tax=Mycolicibacterium sp. F2034L TaxID=2926422 RepID=UPI001FF60339|nr:acyl-CoA dehydrogenase IpdE1 [Mycolicibacterium sp. F2034L]MCK0176831.1 acyl-CoA dehydrogenase family protein [Mycolicibacterium sp. F2034L]